MLDRLFTVCVCLYVQKNNHIAGGVFHCLFAAENSGWNIKCYPQKDRTDAREISVIGRRIDVCGLSDVTRRAFQTFFTVLHDQDRNQLVVLAFYRYWSPNLQASAVKTNPVRFLIQLSRYSDGLGSVPGRDKRFLSSPQRPDRLWGPPTLLSNEY
jgi:hypothetical protein